MTWETALFIIGIIAVCSFASTISDWVRAKHGYPLEDDEGEPTIYPKRTDDGLQQENAQLKSELESMHKRMAVLERIVTDRGYSLSEEIEALRDKPVSGSGVPLDLPSKEKTHG